MATVPVIMDFIKDPPNIRITRDGITMALYGKAPREKYPIDRREKARSIAFLNPILSAKAPVNGGKK